MKTRALMWVLIIGLLAIAIWLFVRPASTEKDENKNSITFTAASLSNPNAEYPLKKIISNDADFQEIYGAGSSGIDFSKYSVAMICLGKVPTGGFSVKITAITKEKDKILIHAKDTSPGKNCMVTQVINFPFSAVSFEKTDLPIEWKIESVIEDCP